MPSHLSEWLLACERVQRGDDRGPAIWTEACGWVGALLTLGADKSVSFSVIRVTGSACSPQLRVSHIPVQNQLSTSGESAHGQQEAPDYSWAINQKNVSMRHL